MYEWLSVGVREMPPARRVSSGLSDVEGGTTGCDQGLLLFELFLLLLLVFFVLLLLLFPHLLHLFPLSTLSPLHLLPLILQPGAKIRDEAVNSEITRKDEEEEKSE